MSQAWRCTCHHVEGRKRMSVIMWVGEGEGGLLEIPLMTPLSISGSMTGNSKPYQSLHHNARLHLLQLRLTHQHLFSPVTAAKGLCGFLSLELNSYYILYTYKSSKIHFFQLIYIQCPPQLGVKALKRGCRDHLKD